MAKGDGAATTLAPRPFSVRSHGLRKQQLMKVMLVLTMTLFACQVGTQTAQEPVPTGVWGGKGIQLTVTAKGAAIDYGCDSGTIDERLRPDSRKRFTARGTHVFGRGGPRQPGDSVPKPREARYEGVRKGDTLELTVLLPDLNRKLGKFTVQLGQRATLERCG